MLALIFALGTAYPCEPADAPAQWDMETKLETRAERREALALARFVAQSMDADDTWLEVIALRESELRPWVRHRKPGDLVAAAAAYRRAARRGTYRGNPHFADAERWGQGLGMYGMLPANYVFRWDPSAPPEVLCDPAIATVVLIRMARSAVPRYQVETWAGLSAVFGGHVERRRPVRHDDAQFRFCRRVSQVQTRRVRRMQRIGFERSEALRAVSRSNCLLPPALGSVGSTGHYDGQERWLRDVRRQFRASYRPLP